MQMEPSNSSGQITAQTKVVVPAAAILTSIILNPGSAAASILIYDNATTNSGTVLAALLAVANGASAEIALSIPIAAQNGLTAIVTGTGATAYVGFNKCF